MVYLPENNLKELHESNKPTITDLEAMIKIRELLDEFYPEIRLAILEYCIVIANNDLEVDK